MNPNIILEAFTAVGVKPGDVLVVQSSFRNIRTIDGGPKAIVGALLELVGSNGTLVMPAYNFTSWTEGHYFDVNETPSLVGAIPETFRLTKGVRRTRHPIHSLSVFGKLADELCALDYVDSFAPNSVFAKLLSVNATYSTLGLGREMPFLPCHFSETELKVPYRRQKLFSGIYVDENGKPALKTYGFHVRQLGTKQNPVLESHVILCERHKIHEHVQKGIMVNAAKAVDYHELFINLIGEKPEMFALT